MPDFNQAIFHDYVAKRDAYEEAKNACCAVLDAEKDLLLKHNPHRFHSNVAEDFWVDDEFLFKFLGDSQDSVVLRDKVDWDGTYNQIPVKEWTSEFLSLSREERIKAYAENERVWEANQARIEEEDRKEYERLKKKFGDSTSA